MKKKTIYIVAGMILTLACVIGVSYAFWQVSLIQESQNEITSGCFKLRLTEENAISLRDAYPMSEDEGRNLTPYTFTIENICNTTASYQVNLEELKMSQKRLSGEYLKVSLDNKKAINVSNLEIVDKTLEEADTSHKLTTGVLKGKEKRSYELRLWMDESTPTKEETMEATFEGKVTIIATYKESIPELEISTREEKDTIKVEVNTIKNKTNEKLRYIYQLENEEAIETEENIYTFINIKDGNYKVKVLVLLEDETILEDQERNVSVAYEKVYITSNGNDETGNGSIENPYASLNPAYTKVKSGGEMILLSDITATETGNFNIEGKEVTLISQEENIYTILKDTSFTSPILDITNTNTVTTKNITLDGNNVISTGALVEAYDSTLNLSEGTTIQNNNNRGRYYEEMNGNGALGGGVFAWQSTINITGAKIIYNKTSAQSGSWSHGGGINASYGTLNFYDGEISYNENVGAMVNQAGGGIVFYEGKFYMSGGIISHNKTNTGGGGIFLNSTSISTIFTMTGGSIVNNSAETGGGLCLYRQVGGSVITTAYLKNGIIENNTAVNGTNAYANDGTQIIDER